MSASHRKTVECGSCRLPVFAECDVLVAGAGSAGIGAALAAAREGADVLLAERLPRLGGTGATVPIGAFMDTPGGRLFEEFVARMEADGSAFWRDNGRIAYYPEAFVALAVELLRKAGVRTMYDTWAEGPLSADGKTAGAAVVCKAGRGGVLARALVDATADGDLAFAMGASMAKGDPEDGRLQHVTFRWRTDGLDVASLADDELEAFRTEVRAAIERGEIVLPQGLTIPPPETFPFDKSGHLKNASMCLRGVDTTDPLAASRALDDCLLAAEQLVRFCRKLVPGAEKARIARTSLGFGIRETRRLAGRYVVTEQDVLSARKFDDGIALANFFLDVHDAPFVPYPFSMEFKDAHSPPHGEWYEIPYRALLPKETDDLLVAGRCVSSDRQAQGSLRVIPTCMFTGEAAGVAAAMAVQRGVPPGKLDGREVRNRMAELGNDFTSIDPRLAGNG